MPKALTQAQIEGYERDGYVAGINVMSPAEAMDIRRRVEAFEQETGQHAGKTLRVKSHLILPWVLEIARDPNILDVVEDIIGPNILLFISVIWDKKPGDKTFVSYHQDGTYYGFDRRASVNLWMALSEANRQTGCMRFFPGSHKDGIREHLELGGEDNLLTRGQTVVGLNEDAAVDIVLDPGQCSIHHENLIHGSHPNNGDDRRMGYAMVYVTPEVKPLVGRRAALLVRGEDRFGYWDFDPEPRYNFDPVAMEAVKRGQAGYTDRELKPPPATAVGG
ncbi:phytanoyl-CoA dioxygenase family protein [Alphaproteobacteria bacterium]|nr:phytanoyl-CoA dioxygenase family protein [Alphaproteobacteria bacterium]